ncbi:MAG: hypothetical protein ACFFBJ_09105 [Promethearchaeota archaeon]
MLSIKLMATLYRQVPPINQDVIRKNTANSGLPLRGPPDHPFPPNCTKIDDLRIHYVDEGSKNAPPALLLHGEPS